MGIFVGGFLKQQLLVLTQLRKEIEKECFIHLTKFKRNKWNNLPETNMGVSLDGGTPKTPENDHFW